MRAADDEAAARGRRRVVAQDSDCGGAAHAEAVEAAVEQHDEVFGLGERVRQRGLQAVGSRVMASPVGGAPSRPSSRKVIRAKPSVERRRMRSTMICDRRARLASPVSRSMKAICSTRDSISCAARGGEVARVADGEVDADAEAEDQQRRNRGRPRQRRGRQLVAAAAERAVGEYGGGHAGVVHADDGQAHDRRGADAQREILTTRRRLEIPPPKPVLS
ncbi:hypothetical protein [Tahibacter caeni]|uniref:hypothetical protein n=1 Tax=Tahibacter caeni TaxID=1453545 RepID=UPI003CCDD2D6